MRRRAGAGGGRGQRERTDVAGVLGVPAEYLESEGERDGDDHAGHTPEVT